MFFRAEKALRDGYGAWLQGELDRAVEKLQLARRLAPGSPEPLLPLARALSEKGELDRALAAIEEAIALEPETGAGPLFRAIILLDHGDSGAAAALGDAPRGSFLAEALAALAGWTLPGTDLRLPAASRWIPDLAGRLLAVLEAAYNGSRPEESIELHHSLLSGDPPPAASPQAAAAGAPPPAPPAAPLAAPLAGPPAGPPRSKRAWRAALDEAFVARRYARVEELYFGEGAQESWKDLAAGACAAFSLIAAGKARPARSLLSKLIALDPGSPDLHFLEGLSHARGGRRRESAWCFARAARLADTEVDDIIAAVAKKIGAGIEWVKEPCPGK